MIKRDCTWYKIRERDQNSVAKCVHDQNKLLNTRTLAELFFAPVFAMLDIIDVNIIHSNNETILCPIVHTKMKKL